MLELMDLVMLLGFNVVACAVFSGVWMMAGRYLADRRLTAIEAELDSVVMTLKSRQGEAARGKNREEEQLFMAQAAQILQGEGDMKDKIQKVIALNPQMALRLASKLGIGI